MGGGMIAVDDKKLAEALGGFPEWTEPLNNDHKRMAARVITDSRIGRSQDVVLSNATPWIQHANDAGQAAGVALERRQWQHRIGAMFGIPVVR